MTGAAYAVHQLRYLLAYGGHAHEQLGLQAHAYLVLVLPLAAAFVLLAAIAFSVRLLGAHQISQAAPSLPGARALWARSSAILFGAYGLQEWLEGQVGHGHASGVAAIFAHGGWWAIPLAVALGALVAWLLKGAETAIETAASRKSRPRHGASTPPQTSTGRPTQRPALDVVASFLAGRGPPVTSS
jgi:hypothetical protein